MVRIVNGEIVPDDKNSGSKPNNQPFPQVPGWSTSNNNSQQYLYQQPSNPTRNTPQRPVNNANTNSTDIWAQLETDYVIFGNPVKAKYLLAIGAFIGLMGGFQGLFIFALVVFFGMRSGGDAQNAPQRQPQPNTGMGYRNSNNRQNPQSQQNPFVAFFTSLFTRPPADQDHEQ
eukprot:TRINITY_DN9160_c0_g1_i1.p1 TRINITY_DN9160_c0_g1~~TRINITY_DN9160_c0_g1_i1.p1  ORF type:complete len:173 (+),score=37.19 TRINITY_DN9160_c0_g1_i1:23-541(+)